MKVCTLLYRNRESLARALRDAQIAPDEACLARIYTAVCDKEAAVAIARELQSELPAASVIGGTGSGVIFRGKQYDSATLIVVEQFERAEIVTSTVRFHDKPAAQVAREVAAPIQGRPACVMHVLCGDHFPDVHAFVGEFNRLKIPCRLSGGVVGDILPQGIRGYVFTPQGVVDGGIVTAALCGGELHAFAGVNIAHDPISPVYELTKCEGSLLLEIEGESTVDWCATQFGTENLREYHDDWQLIAENDTLVRFPMMLEGHGGASRFVKYDTESGCMSLHFSQLEEGIRFRIGYTSPTKCVQECFDLCNELMQEPVESLFCYSCLFRKMYLENCAEWELLPFAGYGICGVFMMGEIGCVHGVNEFLNGSCCLMGVGEREDPGILPDLNVFEDLYKIQDANDVLYHFVLKRFSVATSEQNQKLLEQILNQQRLAEERLYIDSNTGLHNAIMYSADDQKYHFNKLFLANVENAALLIGQLGREQYSAALLDVSRQIRFSVQNMRYADCLRYYSLNESTLFMAADNCMNEADFMRICNSLYEQYQFVSVGDVVMIVRFVVVLDRPSLLESALNTLQTCRSIQTHFLVCDNGDFDRDQAEEIRLLQMLSRVVETDGVVPYFQGIYDNGEKCITKYEALMRLRDTDGSLYVPAMFMEISKRYHLYSILSKKMLSKVFDLFAGKKACVSINLSALDINFGEMQEWILARLEAIGDASNFIFEILEDEAFQDMDALRAFIARVRGYGVSIAIDDFGSGYSNFMEIARIEPDFLKVDGSIVRNIQTNSLNHKVLENIVFLGKQLDASLVAEFVENGEIQEKVESFGIAHSQGYYFAKPVPYDQIDWSGGEPVPGAAPAGASE